MASCLDVAASAPSWGRRSVFVCLLLSVTLRGADAAAERTREAKTGRVDRVDRIVVRKSARSITLFAGELPVFQTKAAIGPGGAGPKRMEGDRVTPVGRYRIVSKGPSSRFHVFMGIDYPNAEDRARFDKAKRDGSLPRDARIGGDVGIHGAPPGAEWKATHKEHDWTLGCVAVDDEEIEIIAKKTPLGTIVDIED